MKEAQYVDLTNISKIGDLSQLWAALVKTIQRTPNQQDKDRKPNRKMRADYEWAVLRRGISND